MPSDTKHLEITLETVKSRALNRAEDMCFARGPKLRALATMIVTVIGMSVREGVIKSFHYGNEERADKKFISHSILTPTR